MGGLFFYYRALTKSAKDKGAFLEKIKINNEIKKTRENKRIKEM